MLHLAFFCSEVIRSDSEWKTLLHFASEGFTLLQSCAEGSKIVRRASKGTGLGSGKMWDCKTSQMFQSQLAALNAFGLFARLAPDPAIDDLGLRHLVQAPELEHNGS